jgi:hypothetical protein
MAKDWTQLKLIANAVATTPGMTGAELSANIGQPGAYRRLSEVKRLGLVKKGPRRKCAMSGKTADTWFPCDETPEADRGAERPSDTIKRLNGRIQFLVNENTKLKEKLSKYEPEA